MKKLTTLKRTFKLVKGVAFASLVTGVCLGQWLEAQKHKHDELVEPDQDNTEPEQEKHSGRFPWGRSGMDVDVYLHI